MSGIRYCYFTYAIGCCRFNIIASKQHCFAPSKSPIFLRKTAYNVQVYGSFLFDSIS